jgi:hypothetical protein
VCRSYPCLSAAVSLKLAQSVARTLFSQVSAASCAAALAEQVTRCRAAGLEAQLDRIGVQHRRCTDSIVPLAPAVASIRWRAAGVWVRCCSCVTSVSAAAAAAAAARSSGRCTWAARAGL